MKKIAVVTATRAEYGLLSPVIKALRKRQSAELGIDLIVTGTHLSENYGNTVRDIDDAIDYRVPVSVKSDTEKDISANQAEVLVKFTDLFNEQKYSAAVLLGDRYETLAIAIAAGNTRTPIFHLCGGDTTEGALDEWIRHSITKMSYLHFVTNEESRRRVIQLGEDPARVFNYGSTSIDNVMKAADLSKSEALDSIQLPDCQYALCTYHPVTMEDGSVDEQIAEFLDAIRQTGDLEFIVTKSNADQGGARINRLLDEVTGDRKNVN
jgi:GDP/UDP-N,N'-diacetylbacillosamine 2-epimerase (hydrolysing)